MDVNPRIVSVTMIGKENWASLYFCRHCVRVRRVSKTTMKRTVSSHVSFRMEYLGFIVHSLGDVDLLLG
jgi:hypothetical protein